MKVRWIPVFWALASLGAETDPFGGAGAVPAWEADLALAKPYILQVACGDVPVVSEAPGAEVSPGAFAGWPEMAEADVLPAELAAVAKTWSVRVAGDETGCFETSSGQRIAYRVELEPDGLFTLSIRFRDEEGPGSRAVNTEIAVADGQWVFLCGLRGEESSPGLTGGERPVIMEFQCAARIVSAASLANPEP